MEMPAGLQVSDVTTRCLAAVTRGQDDSDEDFSDNFNI